MSLRIVLRDRGQSRWLEFTQPVEVLEVAASTDIMPVLRTVEQRVNESGLHAVGYLSYEAAPGFDPALLTHRQSAWPLLVFGLFAEPAVHRELADTGGSPGQTECWDIGISKADYTENIRRIKEQIELGNTYQINYTIRSRANSVTDPWRLFLRVAADAPYAAYLETNEYCIVSASPELFFELDGNELISRPMKGTARRGMTTIDDMRARERLRTSIKDRAENVMIADMIRNDIGRIAEPGSVVAGSLFRIEKYDTVWQMTSTVSALTTAPVADIFRALFPCASVTGAPKVSSMRIIAGLEDTPRHVYTGAIGYIAAGRKARFSVAIRTAFIDRQSNCAEYGIGGGIVWNSESGEEYDECLSKARVLHRRLPPGSFELLETLRWTADQGYFLLERHLDRLRASATYFDYPFDNDAIRHRLEQHARQLPATAHRVRLLLSADGRCRVSAQLLDRLDGTTPVRLRLAAHPVDVNDPFLYHKTTWREIYQRALDDTPDCDDVLLWNADGYVTETTIANVGVRIDGRLCTPPVDCGLLAGTLRASLLERGRISERRIHVDELSHGTELTLFNSVRECYPAIFVAT